jgi:hypothetical protein
MDRWLLSPQHFEHFFDRNGEGPLADISTEIQGQNWHGSADMRVGRDLFVQKSRKTY